MNDPLDNWTTFNQLENALKRMVEADDFRGPDFTPIVDLCYEVRAEADAMASALKANEHLLIALRMFKAALKVAQQYLDHE